MSAAAHVPSTSDALGRLEQVVASLGSVAVGLSGGVDSSLLAAVCHRVLGPRAIAVVARSESLPQRELDEALATASRIGIDVQVVATAEVADPRYAANPRNRCLFCKDHQFEAMRKVADDHDLQHVAHGEVLDDLADHRPGRAAAERWGARAPLREAGLTKDDVRQLARDLDLPVWDKPAFACLASRIPTGEEVTADKLSQVERAEQHLFELGFTAFRVRHHGTLARIELPVADHPRAIELGAEVERGVRAAGFGHVALDLGGLDVSKAPPPEADVASLEHGATPNATPNATPPWTGGLVGAPLPLAEVGPGQDVGHDLRGAERGTAADGGRP